MSLVESVDHLPSTLAEREAVIERGLSSFLDVGNALIAIKRDRQYREAGYPTFEDYCAGRFQISRSRAYQLVAAAATTTTLVDALPELSTNVDTPLPRSEAQVRPLASLEPEQAAEAWVEAVEAAGGEQPTAAQVAEAVQIVTGAAPSAPTPAPVTPPSNVNPDTGEFLDDEDPDDELDDELPPVPPTPKLTPEEQREFDLAEADARTARYVQKAISNWPALYGLRTNPRRKYVLAHLPESDLAYLADIERKLV